MSVSKLRGLNIVAHGQQRYKILLAPA